MSALTELDIVDRLLGHLPLLTNPQIPTVTGLDGYKISLMCREAALEIRKLRAIIAVEKNPIHMERHSDGCD